MKVAFSVISRPFGYNAGLLAATICVLAGLAAAQEISPPEAASAAAKTTDKPEISTKKTLPAAAASKMKVVFDEATPGVIFVESNGERIRIDTAKKSVESVASVTGDKDQVPAPQTGATAQATVKPTNKNDKAYDFDKGEEPYDYRVVNIPTPKNVPKGTWNLVFTHRFSEPVNPVRDSAKDLFGLDSFGVASFGVTYGITDKLYVSAYRSPLCQRGLCRDIEVGLGYNWLSHDKRSPVALTTYASIEGNDNFTQQYTYNLQAMLSGRLGKRVYLFFSPAIHINSNGQRRFDPRATDFFPPSAVADNFRQPKNGASFGFGASVLITPEVLALFDFSPRTGFKMGNVFPVFDSRFAVTGFRVETHPSVGFGLQRNIGRHSFALTFSNTQATTTSRYNSSNVGFSAKNVTIGFNLSRRF